MRLTFQLSGSNTGNPVFRPRYLKAQTAPERLGVMPRGNDREISFVVQ
jgi:hypothetical protein